jgi:hypothetical protein
VQFFKISVIEIFHTGERSNIREIKTNIPINNSNIIVAGGKSIPDHIIQDVTHFVVTY